MPWRRRDARADERSSAGGGGAAAAVQDALRAALWPAVVLVCTRWICDAITSVGAAKSTGDRSVEAASVAGDKAVEAAGVFGTDAARILCEPLGKLAAAAGTLADVAKDCTCAPETARARQHGRA